MHYILRYFQYDADMTTNHDNSVYYQTLSPLEQAYWHRFHDLFQLVQPQKPEKGIRTLIARAQRHAEQHGVSLAEALEQSYLGASERTHKRLQLLQQCPLHQSNTNPS